jgi:asparagine synthase (glutamine-hydrolysing)
MCGITGWLDYERNLSALRPVVEIMTDTLGLRGPDDRGIWIDGSIALGHRRLSIIDATGGKQPMSAISHMNSATVTFCGEIYNYRELRAELLSLGETFSTRSDTEVLLKCYLRWGTDGFSKLVGMYAFGMWDGTTRKLHLVRDPLGVKPLFYKLMPSGVIFGSEPKALFASGQVRKRVDREGLLEALDMVATPGRSIYSDMFQVRPGQIVTIDRGRVSQSFYWRLEAAEHHEDIPETVERVRGLLSNAVRSELVADVPICSLLSGGLDSSSVTIFAAKDNPGFCSVALRFRDDGQFRSDAVRGSSDAPFARQMADFAGTSHVEVELGEEDLLDETVRLAVLRAVDGPPAFWGDMWQSLYLMFKGIRQHASVALSGEAADELFGGYRWFHNPEAVAAETFPWLTPGSSRYFGGTGLLDAELLRRLDISSYRKERYLEALTEVPRLDNEEPHEKRMREITYLNLTRFVQTLLDRKDRMSMANGLEVRVPYCDHRLVQYVFNVPWRIKVCDGREKGLLRAAMAGKLPEAILSRKKSPYPAIQDSKYELGLKSRLERLVSDRNQPVHPLIDERKIRQAIERKSGAISQPYDRGNMEMVLWLNDWLSLYQVELAI